MNKKIKVIELLNKIANGEDVPSNIKVEDKEYCLDGSTYYTVGEDDEDLFCLESYTNTLDFLKLEVEILEDNTEKIEELDTDIHIDSFMDAELSFNKIAQEINKLGKAIRELRKEKE